MVKKQKQPKVRKCSILSCNNQALVYISFHTLKTRQFGSTVGYSRHVCLTHMQESAVEFSQDISDFMKRHTIYDSPSI